jgi:hypothetical protein
MELQVAVTRELFFFTDKQQMMFFHLSLRKALTWIRMAVSPTKLLAPTWAKWTASNTG